jgi:N-methylhydantoinase A/oxoprolinase/acetone carboxylase beta subunit
MSDLRNEYREMFFARSGSFDFAGASAVLARLQARCEEFLAQAGHGEGRIEFSVEARYAGQVWEIEVPLAPDAGRDRAPAAREVHFRETGLIRTPVMQMSDLVPGEVRQGPVIVETPFTTIVVDPQAAYSLSPQGSLHVHPRGAP